MNVKIVSESPGSIPSGHARNRTLKRLHLNSSPRRNDASMNRQRNFSQTFSNPHNSQRTHPLLKTSMLTNTDLSNHHSSPKIPHSTICSFKPKITPRSSSNAKKNVSQAPNLIADAVFGALAGGSEGLTSLAAPPLQSR